ncbi:MAG: fliF [Ramlibacter sp.]|nr:fliF [Ramlibacter sp.]
MDKSWSGWSRRTRLALGAGCATVLVLLAFAGWWLLRGDPAVLFSDLRAQDAAVMSAELDKLKVPYTLADNGATLLVERSQVHQLRLKLMGRDLPLHGGVGFEVFNTSDFGMTEFAQKINYQRAMQGELTRTILSFPEIREARVHLALPEQGLFKQNATRPKAAVTLGLRSGQVLRAEQVNGIQRLVAAAVPGMSVQEVTVLDQQGVALSRAADADGEAGSSGRLEIKRETENYLSRKAGAVLEQAFGPGQALASVDVTLNMDQVRVTTEDVIGAPDGKGGAATGVLVRERESARDSATADPRSNDTRAARGSSMQRDVEYQAGRRVEHLVSQPGAIRRMQVVALVRQPLDEERRGEVQRLVGAAVGASVERGDTVVVQTVQAAPPAAVTPSDVGAAGGTAPASAPAAAWWASALVAVLGALLATLAWTARTKPRRSATALTQTQREAALRRMQGWLLEPETVREVSHAHAPVRGAE